MVIQEIINKHLGNDAILLHEEIEGRMDINKEKHFKKLIELQASFIDIKTMPVNADTLNQPQYVRYYRITNDTEHLFCHNWFLEFLGKGEKNANNQKN